MPKALTVLLLLLAGCATSTPVARSVAAKAAVVPQAPAPPVSTVVLSGSELAVPLNYNLTFSWAPVTQDTSGNPLPGKPLYKLYNMNNPKLPGFIGYSGSAGVTTMRYKVPLAGQQCFSFTAEIWNPSAEESAKSVPICVVVAPVNLQ